MRQFLNIWLPAVNLVTFAAYGIDKHKAVVHKWRISEDALIGMAAAGGGIGALAGMMTFHHKTHKRKFQVLVPVFILIWLIMYIITE